MRALLVHNPTAGTKGHDKDSIIAALRLAKFDVRYVSTKTGDVPAALREPADLIVVAGGDGTVGYVLTAIPERRVPLAILPLGSANNIARSLSIAGTPQELAEHWDLGRTCQFKLGRARGSGCDAVFAEAFGVGLVADLIEQRKREGEADGADDMKKGRQALRGLLQRAKPLDIEITIDGQPFGGDFLAVEVLNIAYTGPGLPLAGGADPSDAVFDVVCLTPAEREAFMAWLETPQKGPAPVRARRGTEVSIAWRDARYRVDDKCKEGSGERRTVDIAFEVESLCVVLPASPARSIPANGGNGRRSGERDDMVPADDLAAIERLAVELASLAGAEIVAALGSLIAIRYKDVGTDTALWRDPVSEIDRHAETLIRARLAERFPAHDIIGEEMNERPGRDHDFVWAVDPIDGTANFINGFPMFAASIGVLHRGRPVAGAVWCSVSHALRAGVYHASAGGKLRFDGEDVTPKVNPSVRRRLVGVPAAGPEDAWWDTRKTGSAAIECALVAAGMLQAARFATPNIWDVAGGMALVEASSGIVRRRDGGRWLPMHRFETGRDRDGEPDLRYWRGEIVLGHPEAVERMCGLRDEAS